MRILFVKRAYEAGYSGGDRIYDEKLIKSLRSCEQDISTLDLEGQSTRSTLSESLKSGYLPTYLRYSSSENVKKIRESVAGFDAVIVSHEALALPFLGAQTEAPSIFLVHNLLSAIEGKAGVRGLFRARSAKIEGLVARRPNTIVGVLSSREFDIQKQRSGASGVLLVPPGVARPFISTPRPSGRVEKIFVGGTVDWGLKRRDYSAFLRYLKRGTRLIVEDEDNISDDGQLRVALITDRFTTGFKLKASDLIRRNCAVISMSAVKSDFSEELRPRKSVIEITSYEQLPGALKTIENSSDDICHELQRLKATMSEGLTWDRAARGVIDGLSRLQ